MDSIDFYNVRAEKAKVLHRFQSIGFLFRVTEICVALLFACWIFTCLPFAFRISSQFLRRLVCFVSTPLFMFFLGNSIVVALLTTKSIVLSAGRTIGGDVGAEVDIYEAFVRSGENSASSFDGDLMEEINVNDDNQIIATKTDSNSNFTAARKDQVETESEKDSNSVTESPNDHPPKVYRRSKSEIPPKQSPEMVTNPSLRRSKTEKCRYIVKTYEEVPSPADKLTNEEFKKTIEAFITKQMIFRRQESQAIVIHNQMYT